MPFKKPANKKNKTKKQKKTASKSAPQKADTSDTSSVEEIPVTETPIVEEAPLEEEPIMYPAEYEEYMMKNYYIPAREEAIERWKKGQIAMVNDPDYWEDQLDVLERQRSRYHKKAAWSAADIKKIDEIDEEIKSIEAILDRFYGIEPEEKKVNPILGDDWTRIDSETGWASSH